MIGLSNLVAPYSIYIILLICHLLSDYHLQSQEIASRKNREIHAFFTHILFVALPLLLVMLFIPSLWWQCLIILLSHTLIDWMKPRVEKTFHLKPNFIFVADQFLHILIIVIVANSYQGAVPELPLGLLRGLLFVLLVSKPTNYCLSDLFW